MLLKGLCQELKNPLCKGWGRMEISRNLTKFLSHLFRVSLLSLYAPFFIPLCCFETSQPEKHEFLRSASLLLYRLGFLLISKMLLRNGKVLSYGWEAGY